MAENFRQARAKMLLEALDYKTEDLEEDPLYEALRHADYGPYLKDDKRDWVEKHLQIMRDSNVKSGYDRETELEHLLIPANLRRKP